MKLTKSKLKNIIFEALSEAEAVLRRGGRLDDPEEVKKDVERALEKGFRLPPEHPGYEIWKKEVEPEEPGEEKGEESKKGPTGKAKRSALVKQVKAWEKEMADPATPAAKKRNLKKKIAGVNMDIDRLGKQAAGFKATADSSKLEPLYRGVQKQWNDIAKGTKDADLKKAMNYIQRIAIAEVKMLKEEHYVLNEKEPLSIKEVANNWANGEKPYNEDEYHATYPIDDLLEYRDFQWVEEGEEKNPEEWNKLLQDVRDSGIIEPVVIYVGTNGQAVVREGNNSIAIAQQLNIKEAPVKFIFVEEEVRKAGKMTVEPAEISTPAEDTHSDSYYMR